MSFDRIDTAGVGMSRAEGRIYIGVKSCGHVRAIGTARVVTADDVWQWLEDGL